MLTPAAPKNLSAPPHPSQQYLQQRALPNTIGSMSKPPNLLDPKKLPGPPVIKVPPVAAKPLLPPSSDMTTTSPHDNDVLCGRGGTINAHPGNEQYRKFVDRKKRVYLTARFKREKRLIAQSIVDEIRSLDPPGRFLLKDSHGDLWRDVGDEKARDKTSQALRENALSVRKQMEEEFQETRRQQAREVAIAAGRDPEEAVKNLMTNTAAAGKKKPAKQPMPPPQQPPAGRGFAGRSGFGPLYQAQQPAPPQPQAQWGYGQPPQPGHPPQPPAGYSPHGAPPHSYPYFQPPHPGMQPGQQPGQPQQQQQPMHYSQHPAPQHYHPQHHPSQPGMPPNSQYPQYNPHWQSSPQHQHPQQQQQQPPQQQQTINQPMLAPSSGGGQPQATPAPARQPQGVPMSPIQAHPTVPSTVGYPSTIESHLSPIKMGTIDHPAPPPGPAAATAPTPIAAGAPVGQSPMRANSPHVQFQLGTEPQAGQQMGIPLVIGAKKKIQPRPRPGPRSTSGGSDYSPDPSSALSQGEISPRSRAESQDAGMSQAMTETTPFTFLSGDMSVKTSDSLSHYLRGIEDEISGDVGQEVELVAHAPMLGSLDQSGSSRQRGVLPPHPSMRSTPPRHNRGSSSRSQKSGSSGRRRKKRSGDRVPSNSGKVRIEFGSTPGPALGPVGAPDQAGGLNAPAPVDSDQGLTVPCYDDAAGCGVILPSPLRGSNSGPNRSPPASGMGPPQRVTTSPSSPGMMSPGKHAAPTSPVHSLDLEKMSLCGTENVSQQGGSIGGASLCNVFDDNSAIGASALMDMSIGSHPSSGPTSDRSQGSGGRQGMGLQPIGLIDPARINPNPVFDDAGNPIHPGENASLIAGCAALMDMSVGSNNGSKAGSKTGSSSSRSGGSSGGKGGRGSPASVDKNSIEGMKMEDDGGEPAPAGGAQPTGTMYAHYDAKFTWDGKRDE